MASSPWRGAVGSAPVLDRSSSSHRVAEPARSLRHSSDDRKNASPRRSARPTLSRMRARASEGARFPHYEAFLAVVETGNLTPAARHLGRSLQSVSRSLAALEEQLGLVLVRRTTRSAQPTDAGRHFYERLGSALREI